MSHSAVPVQAVALAAVVAAAVGACAGAERGTLPGFTRSDSAGFAIATNTAPVTTLATVFTVDSAPRLRIGVEAGEEALQFTGIEGIVRLDDGRLVVANERPLEMRIFSPTGEFLARLGGQGQGPGEFQALTRLMAGTGDTVLAVNMPYFQLLRFTVSGGYIGLTTASPDSIDRRLSGMRQAEGASEFLRNGSMVVAAQPISSGPDDGSQFPTGELFRRQTTLVWISADYARSAVIGTVGGIEQMFVAVDGGRRTPIIPPNSRRSPETIGGRGTRFCSAGNETPEIRCIDEDGRRLIVRWSQDSIATSEDEIERWRANLRANAARPGSRTTPQAAEKIISATIIPPTVPPVTYLLVDAERRILVSGPDLVAPPGWLRVRVFAANGELLGIADLPRVATYELGDDYLLGRWRNDDGVEFVVAHDVRRR